MKNKGISLIVLVITIIVMLVLAGAVIITLSNTNIVTKAKEAVLKTDVKSFEQELSVSLAEKKIANKTLDITDINEADIDNIQEYIPSLDNKYDGKIAIKNGELVYVNYNVTDEEKTALEAVGILSGEYITKEQAEDILTKANAANLEDTDSTTDITEKVSGVDASQAYKFVIYRGHIYYRYERTTLAERKILQQAGISCLMGDCNANGTLDEEDVQHIDNYAGWVENEFPNNLYFVGDANLDGWIDGNDASNLDLYVYGIMDYDADIDISKQIPEKMELFGLHYKTTVMFLDNTENVTDYAEIMGKIPLFTAKEAKKVVIQDGTTYIKTSALTEQEKTWAEEINANVI